MSALPLRPFGVPDLVWPPGVCEACYEPQWSDALRDWEFVEGAAGPCGACQVLQMTTWTIAGPAPQRERSFQGTVSDEPNERPSRRQLLTRAGARKGSR